MTKFIYNKKHTANINDNRYERITELKHMKKNILSKIYA